MKHEMKILKLLTIGTFLTYSRFTYAQGGGVHGGGQIIEINSNKYLFDLATKSTGEWEPGSQIISENSYINHILAQIAQVDWYFAASLKQQIESLQFCLTGALYRVDPSDRKNTAGIVLPPDQFELKDLRQAGYRDDENVYLDKEFYTGLQDIHRAFLIIHEAVHSYFPMDTVDRNFNLRSFVKYLRKIDGMSNPGSAKVRKQYLLQLEKMKVNFPRDIDSLTPMRKQIEFLLSDVNAQIAALNQTTLPESLVAVDMQTLSYGLTEMDYQKITDSDGPFRILKNAIKTAMVQNTSADFSKYLNVNQYDVIDSVVLALQVEASLSQEKKKILIRSQRFSHFLTTAVHENMRRAITRLLVDTMIDGSDEDFHQILRDSRFQEFPLAAEILQRLPALSATKRTDLLSSPLFQSVLDFKIEGLNENSIYLKMDRTRASLDFQALSGSKPELDASVASLNVPNALPKPYAWTVSLIQLLVRANMSNIVQQQIFEKDGIYKAIGLIDIRQKALTMPVAIPREKSKTMYALNEMSKALVVQFMNELKTNLNEEEFTAVNLMIHYEKFNNN